MNDQQAPRRIRQHISIQQVGTETLVYDEQRHKAFCLNASCAAIWRLADGERTVAEISAAAAAELGAAVSEELVRFTVDELRRDGLMEPRAAPGVVPTVSRRAMLQRLGAGGAMLLPVVAAIVAPTAAQAYSGCFDCSTADKIESTRLARVGQMARIRNQQLRKTNTFPILDSGNDPIFPAFNEPDLAEPEADPPK